MEVTHVMSALLVWLAANSPFNKPPEYPEVYFDHPMVIENMMGTAHSNMKSPGAYHPESDRIFLSKNVDISTSEGRGILLHELVHWMQDNYPSDYEYACKEEKELEAYYFQNKYVKKQGSEANIDWVYVNGKYACSFRPRP